MTIDVIILTDSSDVALTQRTIDTLHDSEIDFRFRVQLVDSGTQDPNRYVRIHNYIHPESSFNYNKFLNIAFTYCLTEWVVISNDDVAYERWWFSEMMKVHDYREDIEAFSPKDPLLYARWFPNHFVGTDSKYHEWIKEQRKYVLPDKKTFDKDSIHLEYQPYVYGKHEATNKYGFMLNYIKNAFKTKR